MQIVIDIDEELLGKINDENYQSVISWYDTSLYCAIKNGTPLPKGHGRLIDADEALNAMGTWDKFGFDHTGCFVREPKDDYVTYVHYEDMVKAVSGMPTIIDADRGEE